METASCKGQRHGYGRYEAEAAVQRLETVYPSLASFRVDNPEKMATSPTFVGRSSKTVAIGLPLETLAEHLRLTVIPQLAS
jgi:hypothetical protein